MECQYRFLLLIIYATMPIQTVSRNDCEDSAQDIKQKTLMEENLKEIEEQTENVITIQHAILNDLKFRRDELAKIKIMLEHIEQHHEMFEDRETLFEEQHHGKHMYEPKGQQSGVKNGNNNVCHGNENEQINLFSDIHPSPIRVLCDASRWIVLMRRVDDEHNFPDRGWEDYKRGFGDMSRSFWPGLEYMHVLTTMGHGTLRVELQSWFGETRWAEYSSFRIDDEDSGYGLHVDGYTGDAGNGLEGYDGVKFQHPQHHQDHHAVLLGPWWCKEIASGIFSYSSLLNGEFLIRIPHYRGMKWLSWNRDEGSFQKVEMKLRLMETV